MSEYFRVINTTTNEWIGPATYTINYTLAGLMRSDFLGIRSYLCCYTQSDYITQEDTTFTGSWDGAELRIAGDTTQLYTTVVQDSSYTRLSSQFTREYNQFATEQLLTPSTL